MIRASREHSAPVDLKRSGVGLILPNDEK